MSVVNRIQHYQRSLERCTDNEPRTLHCIDKLYKLPVTVQHLKVTGVGRTVNALRKFDGSVGDAAKALVAKWKTMVVDDETSEEEDEACVPDAPEGYSDRSNSPKFDRDNGDDRNSSNYKSTESREKQSRSTDKHESSRHGTKNSSSSSENSKPRENELKSSRESSGDKYKCSKNGIDKRHTKSETKNESRNDTKSEKKSKSSRDSKSESRKDSGNEPSTSAKGRVKTEDSRKDSSRVSSSSSSSNGGTSKNSNNNHDSHRKRKHESPSNERESSKRRKSLESPVEDEYDDPDEIATQVLSRDSDDETGKNLPDTSIESDSEEETSKTKAKYESPVSPAQYDRGSSSSRHSSSKTEKSSKSKSRESSGKATTSGSVKSRRENDKNEKSKSDKTSVDHRKNEKRKDRSPSKESSSKSRSHSSSSSSSKDHVTSKDKDEYSEIPKGKKDKSECDSKESKEKFKEPKDKKVKKKKISKDDGIDCNSGASFAEALGMCTDRPMARKKANPVSPTSPVKTVKTEPGISTPSSSSSSGSRSSVKVKSEPQASSDPEPLSLLAPNVKLEPLNVDLASTLPEISPNYKPLPAHYMNPVHRKQEESRALSDVIYAKTQRTKVYSGMKSGYTSVPTLCEEAIRVLIENIHELGFTGGIPYDIIKPVLERATPDQLFTVENYNPYLIEDTDQLWQFHCNREFRTKKREEMESWRDMYLRCREEREAKLKALTANIKESIDKSVPVRSAKLAYVDKPPRNVLRQQAKYGTAKISTSSSDLKKQMILSGSSNAATNIAVPPPPMARHKSSSSGVMKKNKAPLMAKALQLIKGRYKR